MIKIIKDFLPKPLFDYMQTMVHNKGGQDSQGLQWSFNERNLKEDDTTPGAENYKFGKNLYIAPGSQDGRNPEIYDRDLMPLFGLFQTFMMSHMEKRCQINEEKNRDNWGNFNSECRLIRMKMNLYPNKGKQVKHGVHNDIFSNGRPNPNVVTAVFNFTDCNGSTVILDKDKNGEYTKEVEVPSVANTIAMFNCPHPHYGVTQSDTPTRIVLNINLEKAYVDPMGKELGDEGFEPLDDYF
jgi:hypothetical protein|tara:strand:- start:130 stop:849 length:720 start_codon:yes stop_codon:yes gene_type:complete